MNFKNRYIFINFLAFEFLLLNLVLLVYLYFTHTEFNVTDLYFLKKVGALSVIYNISWLFIILYVRGGEEFYFSLNKAYLKSLVISTFFFVGIVTVLIVLFGLKFFEPSVFIVPILIFAYLNLISHKYLLQFFKKKGFSLIFQHSIDRFWS